eukprot:scaffold87083_cov35-Prasinocladus_malaysianus.AAC.1
MDVVYVLNTSTDPILLANGGEQEYLRRYHSALLERLKILGDHKAADSYTWELFCHHYDVRFYPVLGDNAHGQCFVVAMKTSAGRMRVNRVIQGNNNDNNRCLGSRSKQMEFDNYDLIVAKYQTGIQLGALMVLG